MDRRWLPVAVAGAVLAASLVPGGGGGAVGPVGVDKLLHVVGYTAITVAGLFARRVRTPRAVLAVAVVVTAFGGAVELLQGFVPGRGVSALDLVADGVGAALGAVGWWLLGRPPADD